ncbi:hypothetical protein NC651_009274 [Populus alba x Populus x berolinensis]|nr:hypothetical protein NC651_009274 [Populus alba x Populus x berolinensis]
MTIAALFLLGSCHHLVVGFNNSIQRRCLLLREVYSLPAEQEEKMGFIMEFAENLILRLMEDPRERDRKFRERVYAVKDRCQKTKEMWSYPLRPYGFWTFERHNAQLAWDAKISQVPGRRDPYDDLLQDSYGFPK